MSASQVWRWSMAFDAPACRLSVVALVLGLAGMPVAAQQRQEHGPRELPRSGETARPDHRPRPERRVGPVPPDRPRPSDRPAGPPGAHGPVHPKALAPAATPLGLDLRHRHNQYYPPRGRVVPALPPGSVSITYGGGNLFFHAGVWFRPAAGRFVVVAPPLGVVVPSLPPAVVSLWIGGAPYYYANGVYFAAAPEHGYLVVAPPPGAEFAQPSAVVTTPAEPPEPVIYPRLGQTPEQTEAERRECNRWATTQAGAIADASVFQRAVAACMEGRGYTVR